jgi:teichuronic acid biosynthesis glycosyltransferase TuaC
VDGAGASGTPRGPPNPEAIRRNVIRHGERMRILTLTNMYPTDANPTYGTFVADQAAALRRHPRVERCDVMFIDGRASRWNYFRAFPRLARALRRAPVDVIHAHYGITGAVAVSQRRVPTVVTYHTGDLQGEYPWQHTVSKIVYRLATDNIAVSRRAMTALPGPAHHVTCGVDTTVFTPRERAAARETFGIADGELALLFPSSPRRVVKAYPRFVELVAELRRRGHAVHELHLEDLGRDEVPVIMAAADAMALTSTREGAPVCVMEALACGVGIVSTPVGDVASMLDGARNTRVLEFEAVAFADAVEQVIAADPAVRAADPLSTGFDESTITERVVGILEQARDCAGDKAGHVKCA